jgi:hypothetical protein
MCSTFKTRIHVTNDQKYDQIQMGMMLTNRSFCDFVVFTPNQTSIERYEFNAEYCKEFLMPRAMQFYFAKYLPLLIAKERGWLQQNTCALGVDVVVEHYRPEIAF